MPFLFFPGLFLYLYLCLYLLYFIFIYGWYLYLCLWPCLVHVVFVHPCIKSLVDQVQHLKELKRAAGPCKVVEPVNLGKEEVQKNKIWFIVLIQAQKHGKILSQRLDLTSEKRTVADSNISEVGLPYFRFSATDIGNIWWVNLSDLKNGIADCWVLISNLFFCFCKSISLARRAKDRIWGAFTAFLHTHNTDHVTYFW